MESVKIAIVEDEIEPLRILLSYISLIDDVVIVGTAEDVDSANQLIFKTRPDIVLLDIRLYGRSAFEILEHFKEQNISFAVVIITADSNYREQVFNDFGVEFNIFNYLLKPIDKQQLITLIERYKQKRPVFTAETFKTATDKLIPQKLVFDTQTHFYSVDPHEIIYCCSSEKSSRCCDIIIDNQRKIPVSKSIGEVTKLLPPEMFDVLDQSTVVNRKYIYSINKLKNKCMCIKDNQMYEIDMAKSQVNKFISKIKALF